MNKQVLLVVLLVCAFVGYSYKDEVSKFLNGFVGSSQQSTESVWANHFGASVVKSLDDAVKPKRKRSECPPWPDGCGGTGVLLSGDKLSKMPCPYCEEAKHDATPIVQVKLDKVTFDKPIHTHQWKAISPVVNGLVRVDLNSLPDRVRFDIFDNLITISGKKYDEAKDAYIKSCAILKVDSSEVVGTEFIKH